MGDLTPTWVPLEERPLGLMQPHPARKPHPCNDMTARVNLGDGAVAAIVNPYHDSGVEWMLRYGEPEVVCLTAASLLSSYDYLLSDEITAQEAIRRLRLMRQARAALAASTLPGGGE